MKYLWGTVLSILGIVGGIFVIASNIPITETEERIETASYETEIILDSNMDKGTQKIEQEGIDGEKKVKYEIAKKNNTIVSTKKKSETIIKEPVKEIIRKGTRVVYICSNGNKYYSQNEKDECEKRVQWENNRVAALNECNNTPGHYNCWYDNYPGTTVHWTEYTRSYYTPSYSPTYNSPNYRTGAICRDGWRSSATGRGACSHHGGVAYWL